tara:strand:- start:1323 stop:1586 length:264 start_codon:yes stop_codon:yes gene_type:complete
MSPTIGSTRFRIILIAVALAVLKEVAAQYGIEISMETFIGVEAMLLSLAGLDTLRPLGLGKPAAEAADAVAVVGADNDSTPTDSSSE